MVDYAPNPGACGVGACTSIVLTLGGPGDTSGAGIDRNKPARPPYGLVCLRTAKQEMTFFDPQEVSHRSLWTSSELNATRTAACAFRVCLLVSLHAASCHACAAAYSYGSAVSPWRLQAPATKRSIRDRCRNCNIPRARQHTCTASTASASARKSNQNAVICRHLFHS